MAVDLFGSRPKETLLNTHLQLTSNNNSASVLIESQAHQVHTVPNSESRASQSQCQPPLPQTQPQPQPPTKPPNMSATGASADAQRRVQSAASSRVSTPQHGSRSGSAVLGASAGAGNITRAGSQPPNRPGSSHRPGSNSALNSNSNRSSTLKSPHRIINPSRIPLCHYCAQPHDPAQSAHKYDYRTTGDLIFACPLCQQPLVDPVDASCGHTFCKLCIVSYLRKGAQLTRECSGEGKHGDTLDGDADADGSETEEPLEDQFGLCPAQGCKQPISLMSSQPASTVLTKHASHFMLLIILNLY